MSAKLFSVTIRLIEELDLARARRIVKEDTCKRACICESVSKVSERSQLRVTESLAMYQSKYVSRKYDQK